MIKLSFSLVVHKVKKYTINDALVFCYQLVGNN